MYSRNINRRNEQRSVNPDTRDRRHVLSEEGQNKEKAERSDDIMPEKTEKKLTVPPNYRGMIYEMENIYGGEPAEQGAEGIDRLVRTDDSYTNREQWRRSDRPKRNNDIGAGIKKLVDGLQNSNFCPEDILICAMILLMLNGNSEDDILLVLVLMLLL